MLDIASLLGGDVDEIGHFQKGEIVSKYVHMVAFFLASPLGYDVDENGCFTLLKRILRWTAGDDVDKICHFKRGNTFTW